jgi:hypothetical protein
MTYTVELTNGDTFWTKHVSADEIGTFSSPDYLLAIIINKLQAFSINSKPSASFSDLLVS